MRLAQAWPFDGVPAGSASNMSVARWFHRVLASASQNFTASRFAACGAKVRSVGTSPQPQSTATPRTTAQRVTHRSLASLGFAVRPGDREEAPRVAACDRRIKGLDMRYLLRSSSD